MNKVKQLKLKIFNLIRDDDENNLASKIFDGIIISIIIINVILVVLDTFKTPKILESISFYIEIFSIFIFTIEYVLRIWTADLMYPDRKPYQARIKYIFSAMALVDLAAILPFYIPLIIKTDLRIIRLLRIVRLLRLFKINRYTNALSTIGQVFKNKANQLLSSMFIVTMLMIISSVLIYNVENGAQPDKFQNAFSGMWWSLATLTTIGYGDIYPITFIGRILGGIIALLGIGLVAVPTGIISAGFIEHIESKKECKPKSFCPYCGEKVE